MSAAACVCVCGGGRKPPRDAIWGAFFFKCFFKISMIPTQVLEETNRRLLILAEREREGGSERASEREKETALCVFQEREKKDG